jgi:hypothetical protein
MQTNSRLAKRPREALSTSTPAVGLEVIVKAFSTLKISKAICWAFLGEPGYEGKGALTGT